MPIENNKRILRNTVMLYIRMFFIMGVNLYTSRVLLKALGVEDYGIYNVVGGVITMFSFIQSIMSAGTARFLNFAMGKKDSLLANKTFSVSLTVYFFMCVAVVVLGETVGLWFLNTQLTIPNSRMVAANWVYQFTILSACITMISSSYNSVIISHEKMDIYAYVSIIEVVMKLGIVFIVSISPFDKLIVYGALFMFCEFLAKSIYWVYCRKHYPESKYRLYRDKAFYKEILSYTGWNFFGSAASLVKGQGLNILLNMFFNPSVNAARGIAYQVNSAIKHFSTNFYTAVRPQITKYYASNDLDNMFRLVFRSSKLSFFLVLILSLPVIIEAPCIINLWLGQLPENVVVFVRIILVISALDCMEHPVMTSIHATGNIALFQTVVGSLAILNLPISYFFLKFGFPPVTVFIVSLCISFISLFIRLAMLKRQIPEFPVYKYIRDVFGICFITTLASAAIPYILHHTLQPSITTTIMVCVVAVICTAGCIFYIGMNKIERNFTINLLRTKLSKHPSEKYEK